MLQQVNENSFSHLGASIYYKISDCQDGPNLILLHGGLGSMEDWNSLIDLLERDHRVIAIDSRGQGRSTLGPTKLSYRLLQEDVESLLLLNDINQASVLGFSDGGIVAYRMAISGKINIEKLVAIGARAMRADLGDLTWIFNSVTAESWKQKFPESYMQLNPEPDFDRIVDAVKTMWLDLSEGGYPDQAIARISCSTLIIRGDKDHLCSLTGAVTTAKAIRNSSFLNIPFAGHEAQKEEPEFVSAMVKKFFNSNNGHQME